MTSAAVSGDTTTMENNDTVLAFSELLLMYGEAIRELKLEVDALKNMFFEHRPPFREAFAEHRNKLLSADALRQLDQQLASLRNAVEAMRRGEK